MEDLNYYLKELRLLKDSPNLEQLLLKMENEENSNRTVRAIVTEALASIWQYRRDKKRSHGQPRLAFQNVFFKHRFNYNKPIFLKRAQRNFYVVIGSADQKTY